MFKFWSYPTSTAVLFLCETVQMRMRGVIIYMSVTLCILMDPSGLIDKNG